MLQTAVHWSKILNLIVQLYFRETTICILWNSEIDFQLSTAAGNEVIFINLNSENLKNYSKHNFFDYTEYKNKFDENEVHYNELTIALTVAIDKSHCETFMAFHSEIYSFIEAFQNASKYSVWRSKRNKFIFTSAGENFSEQLKQLKFFSEQPGILVVELQGVDSFNLKTNKFVGPRNEQQNSLILLDIYNGSMNQFHFGHNLFPDKIKNLQGREIILAGFDYRPYFVIDYVAQNENNSHDLAKDREEEPSAVQIDGTECRVFLTFCELHNCTVLIDSSEADDWGDVYANFTGVGSLGMVAKGTAEVAIGAMYSWDVDYFRLDMSMYFVRTGITCLVPAPKPLASWLLPLEPFNMTLWFVVAAYLTLEILSLWFTHQFERWLDYNKHGDQQHDEFTWYLSFKFGYITAFKLFISQSGFENVSSVTVRVILFACFLNDIIITSIYGGGLASILTVPSYGEAADTLDKMLAHKLEWAANSEAWVLAIRNAEDARIDGILNNFYIYSDEKLEYLANSRDDIGFTLERLPFGHYAIGDYLSQNVIEHLKIMQEDLYFQYTVAFVERLWPMLQQFDELLYWWHSAGLDKYWEWRIVADNLNVQKQKQVEATMYSNNEDIGPIKLGMSNFVGILLIWVLGISLASMAFIYELLKNYAEKKQAAPSMDLN